VPVAQPEAVHAFWFGAAPGAKRAEWFEKSPAFDATIVREFLPTYEALAAGGLERWLDAPHSALAYVIVADQFPRNMFRGSPRAFATDPLALAAARRIVWRRWDRAMLPVERQFAYLPFEHAEDLAAQREALEHFAGIDMLEPTRGVLEWARKHYDIIARFGRFPHRNDALGRVSTPEEIEFLRQPGSGF
jgi:uncharacterized protein (DUF924 family)